jgi:hypothetical protein
MTTTVPLPDAGSYVEMTVSDEQADRVRVVHAQDRALTLSAPPAAIPSAGATVVVRWSAAPRGRYALTCAVLEADENRLLVEVRGEPVVEQQRNFVRGGGGEQVHLFRPGFPDATGWIHDISEHSMRGHFEGTDISDGEDLTLRIELGGEVIEVVARASKVAALPQQVPPGPMSVELVAVFDTDEAQARVIRRYVLRRQLLGRARS